MLNGYGQDWERCELGDSMGSSGHIAMFNMYFTQLLCFTVSLPSCYSIHCMIGFLASSDSKEQEMKTGDVLMNM